MVADGSGLDRCLDKVKLIMMHNLKQIIGLTLFIFILIMITYCSDPMSEEEARAIVKTIIPGWPLDYGEHTIFWDGTDDNNKLLPAGTYYARLRSNDFTDQVEMTAIDGSKGAYNDSTNYLRIQQFITYMEQNRPNPFHIKDGTNIRFLISIYDAEKTFELTIRNKKY